MQQQPLFKDVMTRISQLAKLEHRDLNGQLTKMTELYEKTYKISGEVSPAVATPEPKPKKRKAQKRRRSDVGSTRSDEAKKNIRIGILKSKLKRRAKDMKDTEK